jgi:hypothetical protein
VVVALVTLAELLRWHRKSSRSRADRPQVLDEAESTAG